MFLQLVFKASFEFNFDIVGLDEISYEADLCGERKFFVCIRITQGMALQTSPKAPAS